MIFFDPAIAMEKIRINTTYRIGEISRVATRGRARENVSPSCFPGIGGEAATNNLAADGESLQLCRQSAFRCNTGGIGDGDSGAGQAARKLIALGQPAWFGHGEQTLTDTDVRDTWEIPKQLVRVGDTSRQEGDAGTVAELAALLREHFVTPVARQDH
jgi:hypothetical protein